MVRCNFHGIHFPWTPEQRRSPAKFWLPICAKHSTKNIKSEADRHFHELPNKAISQKNTKICSPASPSLSNNKLPLPAKETPPPSNTAKKEDRGKDNGLYHSSLGYIIVVL